MLIDPALRFSEDLDHPDIDPDADFRAVLRLLNSKGVRTISSCQGHPQERMTPYITLMGAKVALERTLDLLDGCPGLSKTQVHLTGDTRFAYPEVPRLLLQFRRVRWPIVHVFLRSRLPPK